MPTTFIKKDVLPIKLWIHTTFAYGSQKKEHFDALEVP
jgi:hypothetical protein